MQLQQRDRRALQLLGAAAAVWVLLTFVVLPLWDRWQEGLSEMPEQEAVLLKYQKALATAKLEPAQAHSLQQHLQQAETGLLQASTPATAAAELQDWIKQIASGLQIELRTSEFLPIKPQQDGYAQVPLGLGFQCRLDQLTSLLAQLRMGPKIVAIPRFSVQAVNDGNQNLLNVVLTVAGVMRWNEGQQSPAH